MSIYHKIRDYLFNRKDLVIFEMGVHWAEDTKRMMNYCGKTPNLFYGFEPDPRNIDIINTKIPMLPYTLNLVHGAISDVDGVSNFYLSDGINNGNRMTGANSLREPKEVLQRHEWISFDEVIKVKTYRLDNFCNDHDIEKIDFIWADIQGSEYEMIVGAGDMLNNINMMLLEYSNHEIYKGQKNLDSILSLLDDNWEVIMQTPTDILIQQKQ